MKKNFWDFCAPFYDKFTARTPRFKKPKPKNHKVSADKKAKVRVLKNTRTFALFNIICNINY